MTLTTSVTLVLVEAGARLTPDTHRVASWLKVSQYVAVGAKPADLDLIVIRLVGQGGRE